MNKKFNNADYLAFTHNKQKFKNVELQFYIDTATDPIKENMVVTLRKYVEDHPSDETYEKLLATMKTNEHYEIYEKFIDAFLDC